MRRVQSRVRLRRRPDRRRPTPGDPHADAQAIKTCAHELAHVLLHTDENCALPRAVREVEAESVAFIVCSAGGGMDTTGYTLPYVAHWSNGDTALVAATGERVAACARAILGQLEEGRDR